MFDQKQSLQILMGELCVLQCLQGSNQKSKKNVLWLSLTWTQTSLTIFGILQEVLFKAWNDNHNIFQMNYIFFISSFKVISIFFFF